MRVFPILFIALTEPKAALLASGLIARLIEEIPHADITLVTTEVSAQLYQDDPRIGTIQVLKAPVMSFAGLKLVMSLRARTYGLVIDVGGSLLSNPPLAGLIKAKTRARIKPSGLVHPANLMAGLLDLEAPVMPDISVSEARLAGARAFFSDAASERPLLVMAPGADWIGRQWPAERFASAAIRLLGEEGPLHGGRLLIIGGESCRHAAMEVRMAAPRALVSELTGRLDLLTAFAALRGASAFIGNESVWLHLAAAAGVPCFGLYGPNDEAVEAPIGANVEIIRSLRGLAGIRAQDPGLNQALCHMTDLSVGYVCERVNLALNKPVASDVSVAAE
jgi:heptosyltransferase III